MGVPMSEKKIIAVLGATGAQGGGLVRAILDDPSKEFVARALTRNANSDKAKQLADEGAQVVQVDIDNPVSIINAFEGAYGAYCVTFFWEHFSPEKELSQAESMAIAANETALKHVVWSTLEDTRNWVSMEDENMPTLMEKYKVPHFDAKGEADKFFDIENVPTTFLLTSFYWDNLIYFNMGPQKGGNGKLTFSLPMGDKKLPGIAAEDIGKCAFSLFKGGEEYIGKTIGIAGGHLTGKEMADSLGRAFGQEVAYNNIPFDVYRGLGFPGADDLGNMFQFKHDYEKDFCSIRDVEMSRMLNPALLTFDEWLDNNKALIPLE
jgi:uncharacterized protein YbjT (DUF2867 family)